jgi:membrane-associated phospholipid phosphatase
MESRKERIYPISTVLMYVAFCYIYLRELISNQPNYTILLSYTFGILLVILACLLFNFFTKISLHSAGFFGLIGALIGYFNIQVNYNLPFIITLVLVGGLVSAGRIYLKAHTNKEVLLGILIGFSIQFFSMKFEWFL